MLGGAIGLVLARRVQMTQMPELVAILHSLVGLGAVLVGFANLLDASSHLTGVEKTIHDVETCLGVLIGAVTLSGSLDRVRQTEREDRRQAAHVAGRHWLNLGLLLVAVWFGAQFVARPAAGDGLVPLLAITVVALVFGIHMVMAIGGADMPVVVSMLNSYSGWAAAATGFMLNNDLLIVTGALVGSSGAILSLHHVPRDESQVPGGHRRRIWHRRAERSGRRRASRARSSRSTPTRRRRFSPRRERS